MNKMDKVPVHQAYTVVREADNEHVHISINTITSDNNSCYKDTKSVYGAREYLEGKYFYIEKSRKASAP